jgi:formate-dependent nitrite reductase membrane component NrfD
MIEEIFVNARANPRIDPVLAVWHWEIPVYLFIGGLTAGIMFFGAAMILMNKSEEAPFTTRKLPLFAPIVLSLGMLMLFLDLSHKLYVWRFYTTFQVTSPMSWGSWALILVYPASILMILTYVREGYPWLARLVDRFAIGRWVIDLSQRLRRPIAWANLLLGVFLGIYTGILLSAFSARPFWNTGVLGPLFLVSGLSTAAALAVLGGRKSAEHHLFTRIDVGLIALELALITLLLVNLSTGSRLHLEALGELMGGDYTVVFWGVFIAIGLVLPLLMEMASLRRSNALLIIVPPLLILFGGYMLRQITVDLGQETTWTSYQNQFNIQLLDAVREP